MATGIDCSFFVYMTAQGAGKKAVKRVSADDMFRGKGGWTGYPVDVWEADHLDPIFFIWQKKPKVSLELPQRLVLPQRLISGKPDPIKRVDHVGIVFEENGLKIAHIGSSTGGTYSKFEGVFERDCVGIRRLK